MIKKNKKSAKNNNKTITTEAPREIVSSESLNRIMGMIIEYYNRVSKDIDAYYKQYSSSMELVSDSAAEEAISECLDMLLKSAECMQLKLQKAYATNTEAYSYFFNHDNYMLTMRDRVIYGATVCLQLLLKYQFTIIKQIRDKPVSDNNVCSLWTLVLSQENINENESSLLVDYCSVETAMMSGYDCDFINVLRVLSSLKLALSKIQGQFIHGYVGDRGVQTNLVRQIEEQAEIIDTLCANVECIMELKFYFENMPNPVVERLLIEEAATIVEPVKKHKVTKNMVKSLKTMNKASNAAILQQRDTGASVKSSKVTVLINLLQQEMPKIACLKDLARLLVMVKRVKEQLATDNISFDDQQKMLVADYLVRCVYNTMGDLEDPNIIVDLETVVRDLCDGVDKQDINKGLQASLVIATMLLNVARTFYINYDFEKFTIIKKNSSRYQGRKCKYIIDNFGNENNRRYIVTELSKTMNSLNERLNDLLAIKLSLDNNVDAEFDGVVEDILLVCGLYEAVIKHYSNQNELIKLATAEYELWCGSEDYKDWLKNRYKDQPPSEVTKFSKELKNSPQIALFNSEELKFSAEQLRTLHDNADNSSSHCEEEKQDLTHADKNNNELSDNSDSLAILGQYRLYRSKSFNNVMTDVVVRENYTLSEPHAIYNLSVTPDTILSSKSAGILMKSWI